MHKVREQELALASQTVDADAKQEAADQNQLAQAFDESVKSEVIAEARSNSLWTRRIAIASAAALFLVIAFLGYKYAVGRVKSQ